MKSRTTPTEKPLDKNRKYAQFEYNELSYDERCKINYTEKKGWYDSVMAQRLCEYLEQCQDHGKWTYKQLVPIAVHYLESQSSGHVYSYAKYTFSEKTIKTLLTGTTYCRKGDGKKKFKIIRDNAIKSVELNAELGVVCSQICLEGAKRFLKQLNSNRNSLIEFRDMQVYLMGARNALSLISQFPFFSEPEKYEIHNVQSQLQVKLVTEEEMRDRNQKLINCYVNKSKQPSE